MRAKRLSGVLTFHNEALRLPLTKVHNHPRWALTGTVELEPGGPIAIDACICGEPLDGDCPMGWVDRNEHSLAAEFAVGNENAALMQQLALSPVRFALTLGFATDEKGAIRELVMSMDRRPPDA